MYAVIETGGKQYRVELGTELEVERLDVEAGQTITLDRVLLVADGEETAIGRPIVDDAAVSAEVVRQDRGEKLIVFKYRPKARRRVKKGHRQELTRLRVTDVRLAGKSAADMARRAEQDAKTERQRLEEAAARQAAEDAALAEKLATRSHVAAEPTEKSETTDTTSTTRRKPKAIPKTTTKASAETRESAKTTATDEGAAPKRSRAKAEAGGADTGGADAGGADADAKADTGGADARARADTGGAGETTEAPKRTRTKKDEKKDE